MLVPTGLSTRSLDGGRL